MLHISRQRGSRTRGRRRHRERRSVQGPGGDPAMCSPLFRAGPARQYQPTAHHRWIRTSPSGAACWWSRRRAGGDGDGVIVLPRHPPPNWTTRPSRNGWRKSALERSAPNFIVASPDDEVTAAEDRAGRGRSHHGECSERATDTRGILRRGFQNSARLCHASRFRTIRQLVTSGRTGQQYATEPSTGNSTGAVPKDGPRPESRSRPPWRPSLPAGRSARTWP